MPNNGFEGLRFLGYPIFEIAGALGSLALRRAGGRAARPRRVLGAGRRPTRRSGASGCGRGVTFHDGTPFNADAVIWNLDRYFRNHSAELRSARAAAFTRAAHAGHSRATARSTTITVEITHRPAG
ncbi:MAG: hypothetical protein QM722_01675 [Piscinibacter sp.]